MTQGELACQLAARMHLSSQAAILRDEAQCMAMLKQRGMAPPGGWTPWATAKRSDLACLLVQALGRQGDVRQPKQASAWITELNSLGITMAPPPQQAAEDPLENPLIRTPAVSQPVRSSHPTADDRDGGRGEESLNPHDIQDSLHPPQHPRRPPPMTPH